jgi:hypothetical protein
MLKSLLALFITCFSSNNCSAYLGKNSLENNVAKSVGGAIKFETLEVIFENNYFFNNSAQFQVELWFFIPIKISTSQMKT